MTAEPAQPVPVCPECGTPPGSVPVPPVWARWRLTGFLVVLLVWLGMIGSAWFRSAPIGIPTRSTGYVHPLALADTHLRHMDASTNRDWLEASSRGWGDHPIATDAELEFAIVGYTADFSWDFLSTTDWFPSSFTGSDLVAPAMSDVRFAALARDDLQRAFGEDWDSGIQQTIAWRVRDEHKSMTIRFVPMVFGTDTWIRVERSSYPGLRGRDVVWRDRPIRFDGAWLVMKRDRVRDAGRAWLVRLDLLSTALVLGSLVLLILLVWLLVPPIWWRIMRRSRHRRGCCLRCGYPLPSPVP